MFTNKFLSSVILLGKQASKSLNFVSTQAHKCCLKKLSIESLELKDKRVLMRVDFNVPMFAGEIISNKRIVASLPSINYALEQSARSVVLMSHLGRPGGKKAEELSLAPVAKELEILLHKKVIFLNDCVGHKVEAACENSPLGSVILLENLRFHIEETGKGVDASGAVIKADSDQVQTFRKNLRKLGDVYVNDAFASVHRAHSSILGEGFKQRAGGFLLNKELKVYDQVINDPPHPYLAILGGSKVSDKIVLMESLLDKVDEMIICGAMAFTFLKVAKNMKIGCSVFDPEGAKLVDSILEKAAKNNVTIHLPVDFVTGDASGEEAEPVPETLESGIPDGYMGLDIGLKSQLAFVEPISRAKILIWNGPPGVFENPYFESGSKAILCAVIQATKAGCITIVGGGETGVFMSKCDAESSVTHVSTGGNATLAVLEGKTLPGVTSLSDV